MGEVRKFERPASPRTPHPDTVNVLNPPPGEDPHAFYARIIRIWTIAAEKHCGITWAARVAENQAAYLNARQIYNRTKKAVREWKLLRTSPRLRANASLRVAPRPAPRRRYQLPSL